MALLWIILGVSFAIAFIISYYWIKFGAPWFVLVTGLCGISLFLLAVGWVILSMLRGESLAASLGMLTFGIPGILLIASGWKMLETNIIEE
jgi:hypothetical protein